MIIEAEKGFSFIETITALKESLNGVGYHTLIFNDIYIRVSHDSNLDDLCTIYDLKNKLRSNGIRP
jgi:hypothetical protein